MMTASEIPARNDKGKCFGRLQDFVCYDDSFQKVIWRTWSNHPQNLLSADFNSGYKNKDTIDSICFIRFESRIESCTIHLAKICLYSTMLTPACVSLKKATSWWNIWNFKMPNRNTSIVLNSRKSFLLSSE